MTDVHSKALAEFKGEKYVSLQTFRKSGKAAATPIWLTELDGKIVMMTKGDSWKVKRLRNNPKVRLAACNFNGKKVHGTWYEGTAEVIDELAEVKRIVKAVRSKYPSAWLFTLMFTITGSIKSQVGLRITLDA